MLVPHLLGSLVGLVCSCLTNTRRSRSNEKESSSEDSFFIQILDPYSILFPFFAFPYILNKQKFISIFIQVKINMTLEEKSSSKSSSVIGIVLVIIVIVAVIGVWFIKNQSDPNDPLRQVTYIVNADGGYAQIIYTIRDGINTEPAILTTPFTRTVSMPVGTEVFLTASNPSQTGKISCQIKIDNRDWKSSQGTHPVDSVACGGIVQ